MDRQLVEYLVNQDLITRQEMQRCILRASMQKSPVYDQLVSMGQVDEVALGRAMAAFYDVEFIEAANIDAQPYALKLLSPEMAEKHGVLPYRLDAAGDRVTLAVYDMARAAEVLTTLETATGKAPAISFAPRSRLQREIHRHYFPSDDATPPAPDQSGAHARARSLHDMPVADAGVVPRQRSATRQMSPEMLASIPLGGAGAGDISSEVGGKTSFGPGPRAVRSPSSGRIPPPFPGARARKSSSHNAVARPSPEPSPPPAFSDGDGIDDLFADSDIQRGGNTSAAFGDNAFSNDDSFSHDAFGGFSDFVPDSPRRRSRSQAGLGYTNEANDLADALDRFDAQLDARNADAASPFDASFNAPGPITPSHRRTTSGSGLLAIGRAPARPLADEPDDDSGFDLLGRPSLRSTVGGGGDFDLFDDGPEHAASHEPEQLTLQQLVEQNARTIKQLKREIEHQRNVLQTLSDLLVEARVVSKKELKDRLRALRQG